MCRPKKKGIYRINIAMKINAFTTELFPNCAWPAENKTRALNNIYGQEEYRGGVRGGQFFQTL